MKDAMRHVIETGKIKVHHGSSQQEFVRYGMRFLDESALQDILNLQDLIAQGLPSSEIFRLHGEDYFWSLFGSERSVIGIIVDERLVAYSLIYIPGEEDENLGRDIGLTDDELKSVAHLQAAVVHPSFRGNRLQRRMGEVHLKVIEEMGFEHVLCTVSPKNPFSLRNILSNGFVIRDLKPKFEGSWRYIMYKNLLHTASFYCKTVNIKGSDIEGQMDLLSRGYLGFDINFNIKLLSAGFEVCYGLGRISRD